MSINLAEEQTVPPGRVVQLDLMRATHLAPSIPVRQMVKRETQVEVGSSERVPFGVAPHQRNLGLQIVNDGDALASFVVHWNGTVLNFALSPGQTAAIPGVDAPGASFDFAVESAQRSPMTLGIRELGYTYEFTLADGIAAPDAYSVQLVRAGKLLAETVSTYVQGRDETCGDDTLDLVARADDSVPTAVEHEFLPAAPAALRLLPNSPNPFNPSTTVRFDLPRAATVDLGIYDLRGRLVKSLATSAFFAAGRHQLRWEGEDDIGAAVASGTYLLRLRSEGIEQVQRMTLIK
jgi:hypothetical protein